ncbi:fumarate hydratase C-terminal domain-containing protein [Ammoniphilus sp. 3BR4]|uniref:fumarate hydratase C-terminal domain-containing protein n=1 Tax=Ammoniphilus sp. 3BR4 TaxID=3158265 RepID=UPI0034678B9B
MATYHWQTPIADEQIKQLQIGDEVFLTGTLYMARDAAHKRLVQLLRNDQPLPVDLKNQIIFYAGPCLLNRVK